MTQPVTPRLSATVMILRDRPDGMEVFMVVRHHKIEFASGAIVFPGGSLDASDRDPRIRQLADGVDDLEDAALAVRVAAAREAFEECGVLYARDPETGNIIDGTRARALGEKYRARLEADEIGMADVAQAEGLRLALDQLTRFAHWVTPAHMAKRFDTHFYLAQAPGDHALEHDGSEAVDSIWIRPSDALAQAEAGKLTMIFATQLNLERVQQSDTVAAAIAKAATDPIVTVQPVMKRKTDTARILTIPIEAGYGGPEFEVRHSALADSKKG
ncbi:MAG: NUDIX hydrolase [Hyphomicrobiaceae bacterium]